MKLLKYLPALILGKPLKSTVETSGLVPTIPTAMIVQAMTEVPSVVCPDEKCPISPNAKTTTVPKWKPGDLSSTEPPTNTDWVLCYRKTSHECVC